MCVRPQTYESAEEVKILSYVFAGRSGLENTSFALLDPAGKKITRGSRSPMMTYGSAEAFAKALKETSAKYSKGAKPLASLPTLSSLRLALNVAAADMRPLIIVRGADEKAALKLSKSLGDLAWSEDLIGTSHYVVLDQDTTFEGLTPALGVTVVQPDPYGQGGKVLSHADVKASSKTLAAAVAKGVAAHEAESREHDDHVKEARQKGIKWETEVPVTDSHDRGGRERRGGKDSSSDR